MWEETAGSLMERRMGERIGGFVAATSTPWWINVREGPWSREPERGVFQKSTLSRK